MKIPVLVSLVAAGCAAQTWVPQTSGTTASLRGVSALPGVVWASGTGGTWLRTTDGGERWQSGTVPGAETLDFRGVRAFDADTAILMASGPGDKSRIYSTGDGGRSWKLLFSNPDARGFFDSLAFTDRNHGFLLGDAVNGSLTLFRTADGGGHWIRVTLPPAASGEGGFAASNTCLVLRGRKVWIGTGGPEAGRVYRSPDAGKSWRVADTTIRKDAAAAGIFSLAFRDDRHGIGVGGEYTKPQETPGNIVVTSDGGRTWTVPSGRPPAGYRSAVAYLKSPAVWLATGTTGSDISRDQGRTWTTFDSGPYNAIAALPTGDAWAVGPKGRIGRLALAARAPARASGRE